MNAAPTPGDRLEANICQATVDAMVLIRSGYKRLVDYERDTPMSEGMFDVNRYFSVLDHLAMEPGFQLDYLYHSDGHGGHPYVYAREVDESPYSSFAALKEARKNDRLGHILVDGTGEGFFQFVVLRRMGGQFYRFWHASYYDHTIVCNPAGLQKILGSSDSTAIPMPPDVRAIALELDITPVVIFEEGTVTVRTVYFTKWGGFVEETSELSRDAPHLMLSTRRQILAEYECNMLF
jgi:hypothetical protein